MSDNPQLPGDPRNDGELAACVALGDRDAAQVLVLRHEPGVRRFLLRLTGRPELAEDLAQDTFVRMLGAAGRYDPSYPMRTWLLTIARRLTINHARRNKRITLGDHGEHLQSTEPSPPDHAIQQDRRRILHEKLQDAIEQLSEAQRQAVVLFHQQGLGVTEAARIMELPEGTVKSHLHRGRAALRKILGEQFEAQQR